MENIDRDIYAKLISAERNARISYKTAGKYLSESFEEIMNTLFYQNYPRNTANKLMSLKDKIDLLEKENLLLTKGSVNSQKNHGNYSKEPWHVFLRLFRNAFSHPEKNTHHPKINYENIVKALEVTFKFAKKLYENRMQKDLPDFQEDFMPIGNYYITSFTIPEDKESTKCIGEFKGYQKDAGNNKTFYAIIKMYETKNINENFITRNNDAFIEASKFSMGEIPDGMTRIEEITNLNFKESDYYIISYLFRREPIALSNQILKEIDCKNRIEISRNLVKSLLNLHFPYYYDEYYSEKDKENAIYHRNLSYRDICLCEHRGRYIPYIINLSYAKLQGNEKPIEYEEVPGQNQAIQGQTRGTVGINAIEGKNNIKESSIRKYLAPEWKDSLDSEKFTPEDWESIDIYSMGVLIGDIVSGEIGPKITDIEDLEDLELSEDFLDMIETMTSDFPQERRKMKMDMAMLVMDTEVDNWK